jgi:apolipoprotein N-acyltransferase
MYSFNNKGHIIFEYFKKHLVPFGEYVPFQSVIPIKKITHGFQSYSAGQKQKSTYAIGNLKILPLICYEIIFQLESTNADVIVNVTNDAWFNGLSGTYQHFYASRIKAVEHGLPLVRSANTGISAIIDPLGRIIKRTMIFNPGYAQNLLPKSLNNTFFKKNGYMGLIILLVSFIILTRLSIKD